ncbi:hypothetical protein HAP47_0021145 [Bradyrhizobium sp. 41S5]|uniref:hypothetical protein n=1 Tax=Bradyrhizobium sp. 41S5 TaxID=1404443 RepID=UPI00156BA0F4|nr:hypothetical protein [Bradyrhizobium sp. 41S5]UFX41813.1 hypothetical protein HAP47_0021145 [Bradyrhizobium sp. 41S5]
MGSTRHKWGEKVRFPLKTEQQCIRCDMVKVGRREGGPAGYWDEFWRDEERIHCTATPPCDARREAVAVAAA